MYRDDAGARRPAEGEETAMERKKTNEQLTEALHRLDERLSTPMTLHVLGGYALSHHGARPASVLTADIDVANVLSADVRSHVSDIARELDLEPDWLNNDVVYTEHDEADQDDVDALDAMLDARYEPTRQRFGNMRLEVADIPTLTKAKAFAAEDIGRGRTTKDLDDLVRLLEMQGCETMAATNRMFPWMQDYDFEMTRERLSNVFRTKAHGPAPTDPSPDLREPPEFDFDEDEDRYDDEDYYWDV